MKVNELRLKNFRNIEDVCFYPDKNLNILLGENGQRKTSLIESLGLLATLKSFRDSKAHALIRWGTDEGQVSCRISEGDWNTDLKVTLNKISDQPPKASKKAFINQKAYSSSVQYLSERLNFFERGIHTITFNPSDHDLVRGEPSIRRAYLDRVIAAEDIEYLKAFQKYYRVLEQRNVLLRSETTVPAQLLYEFTEPLCQWGAYLAFRRLDWLRRLSDHLNRIFQQIAPKQPDLKLVYYPSWYPKEHPPLFDHFTGQLTLPSIESLKTAIHSKILATEVAERKNRCTLIGVHRDDWAFFFGEHLLKGHGSQGETRSALLALKLAEIELFQEVTGHRPLFLLDDFSSELDHLRRDFLLQFLIRLDLQTFITTTEDFSSVGKRYKITAGVPKEW